MPDVSARDLQRCFPNLVAFAKTSEPTPAYNCHAWAADCNTAWWDPIDPPPVLPWKRIFWPDHLEPNNSSLEAFQAAHGVLGFEVCQDGSREVGYEKIVHYVLNGLVAHTARQLPWGTWTSKLGEGQDIEHRTPECLEGPAYGSVAGFMRRGVQAQLVPARSLG